ncbi:GDP-mannose 4,6-dehydratase [Candidatus Sumerlaeota bacterium]|nr:GDP-mannose 4,6-dehydratase [Candidatus Sumerlaeota bacterium]
MSDLSRARVLITGAGGFIGSHVVEAFLTAGATVAAMVRYTSTGHRGHLDHSGEALAAERSGQLRIALGDVTDPFQMDTVVAGHDIVVHMAALIGIPHSCVAPASHHAVNAGGTLNILEASRRHGVSRVIVTSTSEVYGTAQTVPMDESHPLCPHSPYAASKIAADQLALSFHRAYGLPVMILRPFNTYGPRQSRRAVIPTILAQVLAGVKTIEIGNLTPRRDMTFVEDTARAFVLAAAAEGLEGETVHFGSGEALSIGEIAEHCLRTVGSDARVVAVAERERTADLEVDHLECDASKAKRTLGWEPRVSLDEGLRRTADHLRAHPEGDRVGEYAV